jgi:hypothetical protein
MLTKEFNKLSASERKAYYRLYKVKGESVWAIAIHNATRHVNAEGFKHLLYQIHSEGNMQPKAMISIIGEEVWNSVCDCFELEKVNQ